MNAPKVSILCLTYNQHKFVSQAIESILAQKTNFTFEILINDDASTDGTNKILKEYEKKYPNIIKINVQKKNLYSQGMRNFIPRFLLPNAKGEYIAVCEGDDYWTDSNKLQTQVDFLDNNPDYALCFHPVNVQYESEPTKNMIYPDIKNPSWYTLPELLKSNYIPTNSVVYRKQKYDKYPFDVSPGDWFLHLYHAQFGKIKYLDKVMSVYRKHIGGIWWEYDKNRDEIWKKHGLAHLAMHNELLKLYGQDSKLASIINENIDRLVNAFIEIDLTQQQNLALESTKQYPEHVNRVLLAKHVLVGEHEKEIQKLWEAIHKQSEIIKHKEDLNNLKDIELKSIKNTKTWRLRNKLNKKKKL